MSIPKEPRQLMINLMYLILTAMLALNISSEILNAFKIINDSIVKSNSTIESNNASLYQSLNALAQLPEQKDRVAPFDAKARLVHDESDKVYTYLENLKNNIVKEAGGIEKETGDILKAGDIDVATRMFVEGTPQSKKGGEELKATMENFRSFLLSQVDPGAKDAIAKQLPVEIVELSKSENNPQGDWAVGNFFHIPAVGAVTLLSKFQNDVRNSEAMIVQELMREADAGIIKFDAIAAIAVPKTSYALQGQKVEAQIMLAAYNKTVNPTIQASSGRFAKVEGGVGYWESTASGVGLQTVRGNLSIDFQGRKETRPWEFQYVVGSAGASLQLDKMNVFYIGIPNPVTVSASGYNIEDVSLSIPGASVTATGTKGHYNVTVEKPGNVEASIMAKSRTGGSQKVGGMVVRTKFIPSPTATVAGKSTGFIPANVFRAQAGVIANMGDFVFDIRTAVSSFEFSYQPKRGDYQGPFRVNGPRFDGNPDVSRYMDRAQIGDRIYIDNVRAKLPDGRNVVINSLIFTLN